MRVETAVQTGQFAGYASRAIQSTGNVDILVPALWSGTGLVLSALCLYPLSGATVADDTFSFLAGALLG